VAARTKRDEHVVATQVRSQRQD